MRADATFGSAIALWLHLGCSAALAAQPFDPRSAVSLEALAAMRGGFVGDHGLKIALGIDRAVLINGTLIETGAIRIPDLAALAARGPGAVETRGSPLNLIQNGPGNFADRALLQQVGPGMMTIVQNSLDGQTIQGRTVMTIEISGVRSMGIREAISALDFQLHNAR